MNTMKWLVKREFWEHKGGVMWAPIIISAISVILGIVLGLVFSYAVHTGKIQHDGAHLNSLAPLMEAKDRDQAVQMVSSAFIFALVPLAAILFFVMFFYLLGALYDDRSNKSVLFWKSLPVSDRDTVFSKLITAFVTAPIFTLAIATAASFALAIIALTFFAANGVNLFGAVLSQSRLYTLPLEFLATLPIYVAWALPTAGWLLMVSAWARSKPFLWAVGIPVIAGVLISWAGAIVGMFGLHFNIGFYWQHVAGRLLLSVVPGSWSFLIHDASRFATNELQHGSPLVSSWKLIGTPELWIGMVVGGLMIWVAVRLRRFRDEG